MDGWVYAQSDCCLCFSSYSPPGGRHVAPPPINKQCFPLNWIAEPQYWTINCLSFFVEVAPSSSAGKNALILFLLLFIRLGWSGAFSSSVLLWLSNFSSGYSGYKGNHTLITILQDFFFLLKRHKQTWWIAHSSLHMSFHRNSFFVFLWCLLLIMAGPIIVQ